MFSSDLTHPMSIFLAGVVNFILICIYQYFTNTFFTPSEVLGPLLILQLIYLIIVVVYYRKHPRDE